MHWNAPDNSRAMSRVCLENHGGAGGRGNALAITGAAAAGDGNLRPSSLVLYLFRLSI